MNKTKIQAISDYLRTGKALTNYSAYEKFKSLRLSAVIHQLRNEGMKIVSEQIPEVPYNCVKYFIKKTDIQKLKIRK